jgi:hypothetical protein
MGGQLKGEGAMLSKLRSHVRHNVVGYIALFFALTGVAYAAAPLKVGDPAGGDLTGTYPDPSIASGAVETANFSSTIPAARVFSSDDAIQTVPKDTLYPVTWENESYDTAALHSTSTDTSRLTAPVAGVYRISTNVFWEENSTGTRDLILRVNGSTVERHTVPGSAVVTQPLSTDVKLAAGDYVEVVVRQFSGVDLSIRPRSFTMSWAAPG